MRSVVVRAALYWAALLFLLTLSRTAQAQDLQLLLVEGSRALASGDNAGAEKAFRQALAFEPQSIEILNDLAIALAREGKGAESIATYDRALKLKPDDAVTKRNLGIAYFRAARYKEALPLLQSFAQFAPSFQSLDLTGLTFFALDRYPEAAEYLERASRANPADLQTLNMLGNAYLRGKNYQGAADVFARIMAIDPNSPEAHVMMGMAYDKMQRDAEAQAEYEAAEKVDPKFMGVHSGLGLIYWKQGKVDLAKQEFQQELASFPKDPVSNCILGQILRKENEPAAALEHLRLAVAENPKYKEALFELGKSELAVQETQHAIGHLRQAIALDPDYFEAHYVLGTALRKNGQPAEAAREMALAEQIQARQRADQIKNVSR
ncbi:MAG TPA: tetratricopeptide repeat protein [Bryobacteraceae bacterium]|nr:tetratricopeptide repeat protein [Bryobacteraceae bacterium]